MTKSPKPLSQIIEESVQGLHDAWPIDPAYPAEGTFEDRFNAGDREIVLWEIYRCAKGGTSIPEWAAKAFCDTLIRVAKCELSWEEAIGKVSADGHKKTTIQRMSKNMLRVGQAVGEYRGPKDETMRNVLKKKLGLGRGKFIEYWRRYRRAHGS